LYLTRFTINPARRGARKLLGSPQAMHAAVMAGFAEPPAGGDSPRILWRVDQNAATPRVVLYIASPTEPDLTHLVEQAGWPTTENWQTLPYGDFLESLKDGHQWAFRLTANPVRYGRGPGGKDTQRYGHVTVEQQRQWLLSRADRAGFRVAEAESGELDLILHRRESLTFARKDGRVTLRVVTYDGKLEVTDADLLRRALTHGLGHAKAYGCGLLTLAPAERR
jgi:CRISPR system Cascade subunit CasE